MNQDEALKIAMKHMAPGSKFVKAVEYNNLWILQINGPDEVEGDLDPFFSVDKTTGELIDFDLSSGGRELVLQFAVS
jgi:hypothetical protein